VVLIQGADIDILDYSIWIDIDDERGYSGLQQVLGILG
jgi:hypothetical protein